MKLLKYPYPYKAWFTLSNDPDHTNLQSWNELHEFLWQELKLPFSDSIFAQSHNNHLSDQANIKDHGSAILGHYYDTIHTWGDYVHSYNKAFSRNEAAISVELLQKNKISPLVWVDHSSFEGNFMRSGFNGVKPFFLDAAGYKYKNDTYSIDLAYDLGVRYLWDGKISPKLEQKPKINKRNELSILSKLLYKNILRVFTLLYKVSVKLDLYGKLEKSALGIVEFEEGHQMYCFRRYGTWRDAHIDGICKLINTNKLNKLVRNQSVCCLYTHLGKRLASKKHEKSHLSEETKSAFRLLRKYYEEKKILITPISVMFDYVVLTQFMRIDRKKQTIIFLPDGIRFKKLTESDLVGHEFSLKVDQKIETSKLKILVDSVITTKFELIKNKSDTITLKF